MDCWLGVTDHQTGNAYLFYTYFPHSGQRKVHVANGKFSVVAGTGFIQIVMIFYLTMFYMFLVYPIIFYLSASWQKIWIVMLISPNLVIFRTWNRGRGFNARVVNGLYHLSSDSFAIRSIGLFSISTNNQILLLHHRLGHPSFVYMKHLFPSLFKYNSLSFQCDVCQLAKHTRKFLPSQL